jgi:hypothetical protein
MSGRRRRGQTSSSTVGVGGGDGVNFAAHGRSLLVGQAVEGAGVQDQPEAGGSTQLLLAGRVGAFHPYGSGQRRPCS